MSRDLGRDVPDLEKMMQENIELIFRTLTWQVQMEDCDAE